MMINVYKYFDKDAKIHLNNVLHNVFNLSKESIETIRNLMKPITFKKNAIIFNENESSSKIYFIHKGLVKVYSNLNENIIIDRFYSEGDFLSLLSGYSSMENIYVFEAMEKAEMLEITREDFRIACNESKEIQEVFTTYLVSNFKIYAEMVNAFKGLSTTERYNKFLEKYSGVANRVSLKDIANFLGMTSETISRIRAKQER